VPGAGEMRPQDGAHGSGAENCELECLHDG
jgi:hypothetical protein